MELPPAENSQEPLQRTTSKKRTSYPDKQAECDSSQHDSAYTKALQWKCSDVIIWLADIGLGQYADKFEEQDVDGDILLHDLDENLLLDDLEVSPGDMDAILQAIRTLKEGSDPSPHESDSHPPSMARHAPHISDAKEDDGKRSAETKLTEEATDLANTVQAQRQATQGTVTAVFNTKQKLGITRNGRLIKTVKTGSQAAKHGIKTGWVISAVNTYPVSAKGAKKALTTAMKSGPEMSITFQTDDQSADQA